MTATRRDGIGSVSSGAGSTGDVYAPRSDASVVRLCHAVAASVRASLPASAASADENASASSLLRALCLRASSSFVFTSARSKSRRIVFSASPAELLYEYVAFAPLPLTTICGFLRAAVHHDVHFSS